jgi:putative NIF3 family GTP cyclohydrolase 1 type 2
VLTYLLQEILNIISFFDAEDKIIIADIGHYESEQYTVNLIYENLKEKFSNFALHLTEVNTNPVKYI